jgi:hypothetical protein
MKKYRSWPINFANKIYLICLLPTFLYQSSCAAISKKKEIAAKKEIVEHVKKTNKERKDSNKNTRKTLSGHGEVAGDSFLNKKQ